MCVPKFTTNLYCICLNKLETYAWADAAQICGNMWNAEYDAGMLEITSLEEGAVDGDGGRVLPAVLHPVLQQLEPVH